MADTLFPLPEDVGVAVARAPKSKAPARVVRPERAQVRLRPLNLEALVPDDHQVRAVWAYVQRLDLAPIYAKVAAVEGGPGRPTIDPQILMTLWLCATLDGVGSGRAIERLCEEHTAYMWICGGVHVCYHTITDFRTKHEAAFDRLLTESVALLRANGLVEMVRVAQDGMRIRASAGTGSFRREASLEAHLEEAKQQVERLRKELDEDPAAADKRRRAAKLRAAEDRERRVEEAIRQLPEVRAKKPAKEKAQARVSLTDPDARVMKMGDGGFRPAFNAELATDTATQVIVGVELTNVGSDRGRITPMLEQLAERHGVTPKETLVDGGFVSHTDIETATNEHGTTVYAPVRKPEDAKRDPHAPLPTDSEKIREWRARMGTEAAKEIYKERAASIECVNANLRNHGLQQFSVRSMTKARTVLLLFALAHNLLRTLALCPKLLAIGAIA